MDEILALQRELAAVQQQDTLHKLSERNCIEILMKLVELDKLKVIYTCNAKEVLTPEQLKLEVQDELVAAGGRALLSDLQPIINVDLAYLERAAAQVTQEDPSVQLIAGELVTSWHLDGLVDEANAHMQQTGKLVVASLAAQWNLPMSVVEGAIKERLGTAGLPLAKLRSGVLYTQAYDKTQTARLRGVLAAVTRPVSLGEVVSRYGLDEGMVEEAVAALLKQGLLQGSLKGRDYMPTSFRRTQRACLDAFFAQNGYLEASSAANLQVPRVLEFVRQSFPDAVGVGNVGKGQPRLALTGNAIKAMEAALEDAVASKTYTDVTQALPTCVMPSEASGLLSTSVLVGRASERPALQLAGTYAVAKAFLQCLCKRLEEEGRVRGDELAASSSKTHITATAPPPISPMEEDIDDSKGAGKKGGGKKGGRRVLEEDEEEETTMVMAGGKGGKKKGGKAAAAKAKHQAAEPQEEQVGKKGKRGSSTSTSTSSTKGSEGVPTLDNDTIKRRLLAWHPELEEEEGEEGSLLDAVIEEIGSEAQRLYHDAATHALSARTHGAAAARRREQKAFEDNVETQLTWLQLCVHGVSSLRGVEGCAATVLENYLLSSRGAQLTHVLCSHAVALHLGHDEELSAKYVLLPGAHQEARPAISLDTRNYLKTALPKHLGDALASLWALVYRGSSSSGSLSEAQADKDKALGDELLQLLENTVCPAMDVVFRRLDKKKERPLVFGRRMELLSQLAGSESPSEVLLTAQQLLLIQCKSAVVFATPADEACLPVDVLESLCVLCAEEASGGTSGGTEEVGQALATLDKEIKNQAQGGEAQPLMDAMAAVKDAFAKKS